MFLILLTDGIKYECLKLFIIWRVRLLTFTYQYHLIFNISRFDDSLEQQKVSIENTNGHFNQSLYGVI